MAESTSVKYSTSKKSVGKETYIIPAIL